MALPGNKRGAESGVAESDEPITAFTQGVKAVDQTCARRGPGFVHVREDDVSVAGGAHARFDFRNWTTLWSKPPPHASSVNATVGACAIADGGRR